MKAFCSLIRALMFGVFALLAVSVSAQEKTGIKEGFALKPNTVRIILMRPTIRVGEQSTGGLFEANADWTAQARENIERELRSAQGLLGNEVINYEEGFAGADPLVSQYSRLFGTVADSVIEYQFFAGNRLPTKKRDKKSFEWGMGPGLGEIQELQEADYLLFISTRDAHGSTGRKILQFAALFAGIGVTSGEHIGYAGLVDLKTGALVWLNADAQMGGDVRTEEGAKKRVKQLLKGFPGKPEDDGED